MRRRAALLAVIAVAVLTVGAASCDGPAETITVGNQDGLTIRATDQTPLGKQLFQVFDHNGAPIFSVGIAGGPLVSGDNFSVSPGVFPPRTVTLHHQKGVLFGYNDTDKTYTTGINGGVGPPGQAYAGTDHRAGEYYLRSDTPTVAGQRLYVCTAAGTPGTWQGIA